jgi:hypothetical protein
MTTVYVWYFWIVVAVVLTSSAAAQSIGWQGVGAGHGEPAKLHVSFHDTCSRGRFRKNTDLLIQPLRRHC